MTGDHPFVPPTAATTPAQSEPIMASLSRRLGGRVIDLLVLAAAASSAAAFTTLPGGSAIFGGGLGMVVAVVIQATLISMRAQSIGKIIVGTMIVDRDGQPAGFVRGFVLREIPMVLLRWLPGPARVLGIVNLAFVFREDRRCLHDYFAGTRVVDVAKL